MSVISGDSSANPVGGGGATRTWVSGVGDDANPCSRTAPCKTFAGAISKTAAGGEINVLDPGGYGGVTITKAITISAVGVEGGVLAGGGSAAIIVNAGVNDDVVLRGLDIDGLGSTTSGIRFIQGASLHVEDTTINNVTGAGIDFNPTGFTSHLVVDRVRITEAYGAGAIGIWVRPNGGNSSAVITDSSVATTAIGVQVNAGGKVAVVGSTISKCVTGLQATTAVVKAATLSASDTSVFSCTTGVVSDGANAIVTLDSSSLSGNTEAITVAGGAAVRSYGNNVIRDGGEPTVTLALK
ncbi:hypothetical protein [Nocardioides stalactiti]|uniref:hypothetical protein n=1 Tax=Nocardioides stalactiti TaxID=2755356 RepID=UPI001603D33B|nr:hypothetical protein [Nocardioides stalactiti]